MIHSLCVFIYVGNFLELLNGSQTVFAHEFYKLKRMFCITINFGSVTGRNSKNPFYSSLFGLLENVIFCLFVQAELPSNKVIVLFIAQFYAVKMKDLGHNLPFFRRNYRKINVTVY